MVRRSLPCPWLPWTWAWGTGPWAPGSGGTAPAPCAVRDRKSTMDWVSNICCRSTCIISGSWLTGTPTGTPPGPPPGPLLVSRKPGGIANVTPLAGVLCDVDGPADWPVDWPVCQVPEDKKLPSDLPPTPVLKLSHGAVPAHGSPLLCRGSPMWYTGVVPELTAPSFPETIPAGALDALPWLTVLSGAVLGLIGTGPDIFSGSDLLRSLLKPSQLSSVDLSQITATSLSACPSPSGSLGLRYHVKTRERRGSSFSQLGLEPNHTGLTA